MSWTDFIGTVLPSGWTVKGEIARKPGDTGGQFSICFQVERGSEVAFMKVFDLERLFRMAGGNPLTMQRQLESINFEIRLLNLCEDAGATAVVVALETGTVLVPGLNLNQPVQYLIFAMADGDARRYHNYRAQVDVAVNVKILKHAAHGLGELHGLQIAHQDIKPSNILLYRGNSSKVADLGRATYFLDGVWHDALPFAGDRAYAPLEVLYNETPVDWHVRRFSRDLYMFGSFCVFLFTSVNLTPQVINSLDPSFRPGTWGEPYGQVVPYLREALRRVLAGHQCFDTPVGRDLRRLIMELCDPDPEKRGSPRIVNLPTRYSLQRYVSILERLAYTARIRGVAA